MLISRVGYLIPVGSPPAAPVLDAITTAVRESTSLTWNAVSGATGYSIYRNEDGGSYSLLTTSGTNSIIDATDLIDGVLYGYKVKASNGFGDSSFSNEVTLLATYLINPSDGPFSDLAAPCIQTLSDITLGDPFAYDFTDTSRINPLIAKKLTINSGTFWNGFNYNQWIWCDEFLCPSGSAIGVTPTQPAETSYGSAPIGGQNGSVADGIGGEGGWGGSGGGGGSIGLDLEGGAGSTTGTAGNPGVADSPFTAGNGGNGFAADYLTGNPYSADIPIAGGGGETGVFGALGGSGPSAGHAFLVCRQVSGDAAATGFFISGGNAGYSDGDVSTGANGGFGGRFYAWMQRYGADGTNGSGQFVPFLDGGAGDSGPTPGNPGDPGQAFYYEVGADGETALLHLDPSDGWFNV